MSSTAFQINNIDHYFGDVPIPASSNRTIIVYKIVAGNNVTVIPDAGLLEPTSGKLSLNSFAPTNDTISVSGSSGSITYSTTPRLK